ncbi:hypothetical protein PG993_014783 [Apiospora rasikravindrae]|uniref:Uncharacterized protein n=1 Tax=Apiospora rasikravindrae TaxID=990691 RepID=A0ABR1RPZ3_9PEZI
MATPEETKATWEASERFLKEEQEKAAEDVAVAGAVTGGPGQAPTPLRHSPYSPTATRYSSSHLNSTTKSTAIMNRHPGPNTLLDRHEKAIADILKRFLNMVVAATEPIDEGYTPEKASLNQMQMETETAALPSRTSSRSRARSNASGSRAPLRSTTTADRENKERDAAIDAKTERICTLFNQWITKRTDDQRAAARRLAEKRQQEGGGSHANDGNGAAAGAGASETAGAAALHGDAAAAHGT